MSNALRVIVPDVDAALPAWLSLGFEVHERWGPHFAILNGPTAAVWLSGPQTSAALITQGLDATAIAAASTRLVVISADLDTHVASLESAGWLALTPERSGPGGRQRLFQMGGTVVECFQPR
ncbi:MAG: VOC family protein [Candidatus Nanopelagicales bacterium]